MLLVGSNDSMDYKLNQSKQKIIKNNFLKQWTIKMRCIYGITTRAKWFVCLVTYAYPFTYHLLYAILSVISICEANYGLIINYW